MTDNMRQIYRTGPAYCRPGSARLGDGGEGSMGVLTWSERSNVAQQNISYIYLKEAESEAEAESEHLIMMTGDVSFYKNAIKSPWRDELAYNPVTIYHMPHHHGNDNQDIVMETMRAQLNTKPGIQQHQL